MFKSSQCPVFSYTPTNCWECFENCLCVVHLFLDINCYSHIWIIIVVNIWCLGSHAWCSTSLLLQQLAIRFILHPSCSKVSVRPRGSGIWDPPGTYLRSPPSVPVDLRSEIWDPPGTYLRSPVSFRPRWSEIWDPPGTYLRSPVSVRPRGSEIWDPPGTYLRSPVSVRPRWSEIWDLRSPRD